jgi:hypothetical protein
MYGPPDKLDRYLEEQYEEDDEAGANEGTLMDLFREYKERLETGDPTPGAFRKECNHLVKKSFLLYKNTPLFQKVYEDKARNQ